MSTNTRPRAPKNRRPIKPTETATKALDKARGATTEEAADPPKSASLAIEEKFEALDALRDAAKALRFEELERAKETLRAHLRVLARWCDSAAVCNSTALHATLEQLHELAQQILNAKPDQSRSFCDRAATRLEDLANAIGLHEPENWPATLVDRSGAWGPPEVAPSREQVWEFLEFVERHGIIDADGGATIPAGGFELGLIVPHVLRRDTRRAHREQLIASWTRVNKDTLIREAPWAYLCGQILDRIRAENRQDGTAKIMAAELRQLRQAVGLPSRNPPSISEDRASLTAASREIVLTDAQHEILDELSRRPTATKLIDLTAALGHDRGALSGNCQELIRLGLLVRMGIRKGVAITQAGRELHCKITPTKSPLHPH
ncbi:MAG: MarR family transcriptional regulator [Phycisphaerae bacterium]|nr:MarR family transcriptional regulator [Phycisphaerae bacterium]